MGEEPRTQSFKCTTCDKTFAHKFNVHRHSKAVHGIILRTRKHTSKYKCPLCAAVLKDYEEYKEHVLISHDVRMQMYFYKFKSQSQFLAWKKKVEKETTSMYIKVTGTKKSGKVLEETRPCITKSARYIYYNCHRSGYFRTHKRDSERKRRLKSQGSVKINAYCPAKITAEFKSKGTVKVVYCPTHVGHKCEVSYLQLTEDERREIAAKLAAKIPFDKILDEIRNTAGNSPISRLHLLSRTDLRRLSHSPYFGKYCQSIASPLTSQKEQSTLEQSNSGIAPPLSSQKEQSTLEQSNSGLDSSQNSLAISKPEIMPVTQELANEDIELLTYDPNDPDSDSDVSSDCVKTGKIQPNEQLKNVLPLPRPVSKNKYLQLRSPYNASGPLHRRPLPIKLTHCKKTGCGKCLKSQQQKVLSRIIKKSYKNSSQSKESPLSSKQNNSSVESPSSVVSLQDSRTNLKSGNMKEFEILTERLAFDLHDPDSDSDTISNCDESENIQPPKELNMSHSSSSVTKYQVTRADNKSTHLQSWSNPILSGNRNNSSPISVKQRQLIEKFSDNVTNLSSLNEVKWVEHHVNRLFSLLSSEKEKNEIGLTGVPIVTDKTKDQRNCDLPPNQQSLELKVSHRSEIGVGLKNALSAHKSKDMLTSKFIPIRPRLSPELKVSQRSEIGVKNALSAHKSKDVLTSKFIPIRPRLSPELKLSNKTSQDNVSQGFRSKPKLHFQSSLVKCSPVLKTNQKTSIWQSTQKSVGKTKNLNVVRPSPLKTQTSIPGKVKQYLVPIADKPGKYLIVKKINEPPPLGQFTSVSCNKNSGKPGMNPIDQTKLIEPPPLRILTSVSCIKNYGKPGKNPIDQTKLIEPPPLRPLTSVSCIKNDGKPNNNSIIQTRSSEPPPLSSLTSESCIKNNGKPGNNSLVQTRSSEPPPLGSLTPETPIKKNCYRPIKKVVSFDHNYSL